MHITCEKCSTTYVLDDALIPPQGVPVQCTRCAHVFTARVQTLAPTPLPQRAAAGNSTMMFGTAASNAPAKPPPQQGGATPKTTMMFGAPEADAPASKTMMFGTPASNAEPPKNQTMMFGTPASNAAPPAPAAAASPKSTMMFGTPASNAEPPKNQTMMFGTPASNAEPPKNQTMMFGTPASNAEPPKNQTMMFGTAASNQSSQVAALAQAPVPAGRATQLYGGDEGGEETMIEGGAGTSARTMIFGMPAPGENAPEPPPAPANKTMMFGRSPIPKVTAGTVELAGYAADENAPNESTVRVDEAQLAQAHDDEEPQPPARQERTQRFAMSELDKKTDAGPPVLRPVPVAVTGHEPTAPAGARAGEQLGSYDATIVPGAMMSPLVTDDPHRTLPPDLALTPPSVGAVARQEPATPLGTPEFASGPTLPSLGPVSGTAPALQLKIDLPPETEAPAMLSAPLDRPPPSLAPKPQSSGAGRVIVIILFIIALVLAGVLAWRLFGKDLLGPQIPVGALRLTDEVIATLRLDDAGSQEAAAEKLRGIVAQHPGLVEAHAALVLALAVRFDDTQCALKAGEARLDKLKQEGVLQSDLDAQQEILNGLAAATQLGRRELQAAHEKMREAAAKLDRDSPSQLAVVRASGFALGVQGEAEAISQAENFNQLRARHKAQPDEWAGLIEPEYVLNGGTQLDEAVKRVIEVRAQGETFIRPHVLLARLELKRGNIAVATESLDRVMLLNGEHALAKTLRESVK